MMRDIEIKESFDARVWAHEFVARVLLDPSIAADEDTMTGWFANALMRGYDERNRELESSSAMKNPTRR
jgi:hypothetical protein